MPSRSAVDSTKARRAKAAVGTRTTRETIHKALDLAIAWEEMMDAHPPALPAKQQRRRHLLLDYANVGRLTARQRQELERFSVACAPGEWAPRPQKSDRDGRAPRKEGHVRMQTALEHLIREAQIITIRKAHLLADSLAK